MSFVPVLATPFPIEASRRTSFFPGPNVTAGTSAFHCHARKLRLAACRPFKLGDGVPLIDAVAGPVCFMAVEESDCGRPTRCVGSALGGLVELRLLTA